VIKRLNLTVKPDTDVTRLSMAKWIMEHKMPIQHNNFTSREAMCVVDHFRDGGSMVLEMFHLTDTPYETCPFLDCETELVEDEYEKAHRARHEEWVIAEDLRARGAAGDADAAIAFCKLNHVRLFAAYAG
jgi:hypothetical protein